MAVKRKVFDFCKRWGNRLALAGLLFHGATQLNYWRNDISNAISPSPIRREFQEQFGFPIRGWKADIEEKPEKIAEIAEVVSRERQDDGFGLNYLRIESNKYLKRNILDQLEDIITKGYGGWYFSERIGLMNHSDARTAHHEIKHAKTFDIAEKHPEFLEKWKALATDIDGNSLYRGNFVTFCKRIRGLERLFRDTSSNFENEKLGFVSDYSRSNVYEDIAELCSAAEFSSSGLDYYIFGSKSNPHSEAVPRNEKIIAKLKLAEEYGAIPRGFFEHAELDKLFTAALGYYNNRGDPKKAQEFLEKSQDFITKHPNSVYELELRRMNGELLEYRGVIEACQKDIRLKNLQESKRYFPESASEDTAKYERELLMQNRGSLVNHLKIAIEEYKRALQSGFKDQFNYVMTLGHIMHCYEILDDKENAKVYSAAMDEYAKRRESFDLSLTSLGVNDYLEARGISLDPHEQRKLMSITGGNN